MENNENLQDSFSDFKLDYEDEKRKKKQKLVRNEFKGSGKYGIAMIKNPYENVDWDIISYEDKRKIFEFKEPSVPQYWITQPKVLLIEIDNYQRIIEIIANDVSKIEWYLDDVKIKRKYNVVGVFSTTLKVENLDGKYLHFVLFGKGGQTISKKFELLPQEVLQWECVNQVEEVAIANKRENMKGNPYEKNINGRCPVCGNSMIVNRLGDGDKCSKCSWVKSIFHEEFPDRVMCPNLIPLSKAKKLYAEGKPFLPDYEDFIGGLNFYGEMEFYFGGERYGVMRTDKGVEFFSLTGEFFEILKDEEDFENNANIGGKLLKGIWHEVQDANWLQSE